MKTRKTLPAALALAAGLAGIAFTAAPAQAAGDTGRQYGCAAHWRNTANWNECVGATGVYVRLRVDCYAQLDWNGPRRYVVGTHNPVSRYECTYRTNRAWNTFG